MKANKLIFFFILFYVVSCSTIQDTITCIIQNKRIIEELEEIINIIKAKDLNKLIFEIYKAIPIIKEELMKCLDNEPILKAGCRYEEQYKNCLINSCEYMEQYECIEYCFRKYC